MSNQTFEVKILVTILNRRQGFVGNRIITTTIPAQTQRDALQFAIDDVLDKVKLPNKVRLVLQISGVTQI